MLSFSLVAEALMGLIYHRPSGENSKFVFGLNKTQIVKCESVLCSLHQNDSLPVFLQSYLVNDSGIDKYSLILMPCPFQSIQRKFGFQM